MRMNKVLVEGPTLHIIRILAGADRAKEGNHVTLGQSTRMPRLAAVIASPGDNHQNKLENSITEVLIRFRQPSNDLLSTQQLQQR